MKLHGFAAGLGHDCRHQRLHPFPLQNAGCVVEQQRIDVRTHGEPVGLVGVVVVGVHRAGGKHDRARDLRTVLLGDLGQAVHLVDVEQHVIDPEGAAAVLVQLPHPHVHQRIRGHPEGDGRIRAHAGADRRSGHRLGEQVEPLPGILVVDADRHLEHGRASQVDDPEPSAVDGGRDGQRHAAAHLHAPQALLTVAHGGVEKFNVRHDVLPVVVRRKPAGRSAPAIGWRWRCCGSPGAAPRIAATPDWCAGRRSRMRRERGRAG